MAEPAAQGQNVDPYRAYSFKLEIQGVTEGHFTECSGMGIKIEAIPYRQGGIGQIVHKLPGRVEYADITLRYGLTSSREIWDWFMSAVKGKVARKNVSIVMLDNDGATEVLRWNLMNCWIREWRGAMLNALNQEAAIETVTLVFETLDRG